MILMRPYMLYKSLQRPGRLIGVDVGSTWLGLAVSDLHYQFAVPYGVLERSPKDPLKTHQMILGIHKLVTDISATGFIIGYPFQNGKMDPSLKHVPDFIQELTWSGMFKNMPYTIWDESFTTKAVKEMLYPLVFPKKVEKQCSDMFAATGILQGYMDAVNRHEKYLYLQSGNVLELKPEDQKGVLNPFSSRVK